MQKISKTSIFNFEESDKDLIDELANYLDGHVQEIYDFFEVDKPKEKVEIDIIPTKAEFDRIFKIRNHWDENLQVPNYYRGCVAEGRILYLSINDYKNTIHAFEEKDFEIALDGYKKTLVHEYVHWVHGLFEEKHKCCRTEKYLVEGIAVYLSRQRDGQKIPFNLTCDQLLDRQGAFYNGYYLVTKYFVENYDKNYVLEVFQSNRQARELLNNELFDKAKKFYTEKENNA